MDILALDLELSVCKVSCFTEDTLALPFAFIGKTHEELSLVCPTEAVPPETLAREDGWKAFCICGVLDFSLVGVLAELTRLLAEANIGIFAVSTYNTDYVLVKREHFDRALALLSAAGYGITKKTS